MKWYLVTVEFTVGKGAKALTELYEYYFPAESPALAKEQLHDLLTGAPACVLSNNTIWPLRYGATYKVKKAVLAPL